MRLFLPILLSAIFPAARAFEFTGPDPSEPLDLTRRIEITWDADSGPFRDPEARMLDIWFYAPTSGGLPGWNIRSNLSLSRGATTWDPSRIFDSPTNRNLTVSPDQVHYFEARLLRANGDRSSSIESELYYVEGIDFPSDGGARVGAAGAAAGVVAGLAVVGAALL